ncbi:MAG: Loki-CTERM sorting domain-containing protein [Promethearchaeota archaeon]
MKKIKIRSIILVILLAIVPTLMLFNIMITNTKADVPVPEPHPNNAWVWNVTTGDTLWVELEVIDKNSTTNEIIHMFKNSLGLNITGFDTTLVDIFGLGTFNLSRVNGTSVWYDLVADMPQSTGDPAPIAHFGFNTSIMSEIYYSGVYGYIPLILPLNGSSKTLDLNYLGNIILTTCFDPLAAEGRLNSFDYYNADNSEKNLHFGSSSEPYFINATYFDNGTIREAEYYISQEWGSGGDMVDEYEKIHRVFDTDITDEVEWGVNIGDTIYFGENNYFEGFVEKKIKITGFNITNYWGYWSHNPYGTGPMAFEQVLANISVWNPTLEIYEFQMENAVVGAANNLYPSLPWQADVSPPPSPIVFDKSATIEEMLFMQNNFTCRRYVNFDEVYIKEEGKFMHFEMWNYTSFDHVISIANLETGVNKLIRYIDGEPDEYGFIMFEKNMTILTSNAVMEYLYSDLFIPWDIFVNFTISGDIELYWALLPINPINVSAPNAFPPGVGFYLDIYTNNSLGIGPMSLAIEYDELFLSNFGITENDLLLIGYNNSAKMWGIPPKNFYNIDTANDVITIDIPDPGMTLFTIGANSTSNTKWAYGVSDEIYYGSNGFELKAIITEIKEVLVDLSELTGGFYEGSQVFSEVYADLYYWNMTMEMWILSNTYILIAAANNYWAMAPYYMMAGTQGPPLLYPMGTTGFDFDELSFMWEDVYLSFDRVEAYNYSSGDFSKLYLDVPLGVPLYMRGMMWSHFFSSYYKIGAPLSFGSNPLILQSDLLPDFAFSANITTSSGGADFLFAILPESPVHEEVPNGTLLFYSDIMVTNHSIVDQIEMTVVLPLYLPVATLDLILYTWINNTEYGGMYGYWEGMPVEKMNESVSYNVGANSITIVFNVTGPLAGVFAWAYEDKGEGEFPPEIPGYDILILLGIFSLTTIILQKKRRKK